jgi:nicotinate-nucleotide--dimethylbenzimidazole phosphoribosyltransferase
MAENVTESFCERCGNRYTFQSPRSRARALSSVRVLGKGLRNLALDRAENLDDALEDARAEDEQQTAERLLEAFHDTFSFCLQCRQYACSNCWNEQEAMCLSCAPTPESEAADRDRAAREAAEVLAAAEAPTPVVATQGQAVVAAEEAAGDELPSEVPAGAAAELQSAGRGRGKQRAAAPTAAAQAAPVGADVALSGVELFRAKLRRRGRRGRGESEVAAIMPAVAEPAELESPAPTATTAAAATGQPATEVSPQAPVVSTSSPDMPSPPEVPGDSGPAFTPGASLDDAIAAYEATLDEPEPLVAGLEASPLLAEIEAPPAVAEIEASATMAETPLDADVEPSLASAQMQTETLPEPEPPETEDVVAAEDAPRLEDHLIRRAVEAALAEQVAQEFVELPKPDITAAETVAPAADEAPLEPSPVPSLSDAASPSLEPALPTEPAVRPESMPELTSVSAAEPLPFQRADVEDLQPAAAASLTPPVQDPWQIVAPDPVLTGSARLRGSLASAALAGSRGTLPSGPQGGRRPGASTVAAPQACIKCGLSLSATARFCRRCGTRQA